MFRNLGARVRGPELVPTVLLLVLATGGVAAADGPTAYGQQFVAVGRDWQDAAPPPVEVSSSSLSAADRKAFEVELDAVESSQGPYADGLAEPLLGLARYHRGQGELDASLASYRRALHLVRINDGLYSERQVPVVRELLQVFRDAGDLAALDDRYDYFFRLYGSGQPPYTDVRMQATLEYLRWQREAFRSELDAGNDRRLLDLYDLNRQVLEAVESDLSVEPQVKIELVISQLRNLYLLLDRIKPPTDVFYGPGGGRQVSGYAGGNFQDFNRTRLETLRSTAVSRGRTLISSLLDEQPGIAVRERARLHLELGDWYQWNDIRHSAFDHYRSAFELLAGDADEEQLGEWFGRPVELPDNGAFWQPPHPRDSEDSGLVLASFRVNARGRARDVESHEAGGEDAAYASRLRRALRNTRFRPRFEDGEAVDSRVVKRQYRVYE